MMKFVLAGALALTPLAAAQAQSMTVGTFLGKVEALKKKGPMALFSSDIKVLKGEVQNSAKQLRAEQVAAQKAGRKPATCMPEKASTDQKELLAHFESIPPAQRGATVKQAFASLMRKKYPCGA
jgi:hypothetical protein